MGGKIVNFERDPVEELKDVLETESIDDFVMMWFNEDGEFRITCSKLSTFELLGFLGFGEHVILDSLLTGED